MMGEKQLKVGLRVRDLERSCDLYLRLGFREIPNTEQELESTYDLWQRERLPVTLEPEDADWARIFYGTGAGRLELPSAVDEL